MTFAAALQGVDLRDSKKEESASEKVKDEGFFKDPNEYKHMSDEEKEKETKKLMKVLKNMVHDPKEKYTAPRKMFSGMRS